MWATGTSIHCDRWSVSLYNALEDCLKLMIKLSNKVEPAVQLLIRPEGSYSSWPGQRNHVFKISLLPSLPCFFLFLSFLPSSSFNMVIIFIRNSLTSFVSSYFSFFPCFSFLFILIFFSMCIMLSKVKTMYIYMYIYVHLYIERERERKREISYRSHTVLCIYLSLSHYTCLISNQLHWYFFAMIGRNVNQSLLYQYR